MKPPEGAEEHQTEGPSDNATAVIAARRETHFTPHIAGCPRLSDTSTPFANEDGLPMIQEVMPEKDEECNNCRHLRSQHEIGNDAGKLRHDPSTKHNRSVSVRSFGRQSTLASKGRICLIKT